MDVDPASSNSRVGKLLDEVTRLLAARRLRKSQEVRTSDDGIYHVTIDYEQAIRMPSALLSDCAHLKAKLRSEIDDNDKSRPVYVYDIAKTSNGPGARAMIRFIYGKELDQTIAKERSHRYYADCFETAYWYNYENFASVVAIQYADYVQSLDLNEVWSRKTLEDFIYAVRQITTAFQHEHDPDIVPKQLDLMRNILLRCAVAFASQTFSDLELNRSIAAYDTTFSALIMQALSTGTSTQLLDAMSLLEAFAAEQGINLTHGAVEAS